MLHLFRRYEKAVFIGITFVVILSFSFFGTYQGFKSSEKKDEVLFTSLDGQEIMRSKLERLSRFLASDMFENLVLGVPIGANFLNDGVVRKDFIESGVGNLLIRHFGDYLEGGQGIQKMKEKTWRPYRHPDSSLLSAESLWAELAPNLKQAFDVYKSGGFKSKEELFKAKAHLYLMESTFPSPMLRQVLMFQMQQQKWLRPDPHLREADLAVFGYHTTQDWFGESFVKLAASVVLNVARSAELAGYHVSEEAAMKDLLQNGEVASKAQRISSGVKNVQDYVKQQLRYMGMDLPEAVSLWRDVLLFRSYIKDQTSWVMHDNSLFIPFLENLYEEIVVDTYSVPSSVQPVRFLDLQHLEAYLEGVGSGETYPLPTRWKTGEELAKECPELAMKKFYVQVKEVSTKGLASEIPLKQVWAFETSEKGWDRLVHDFPILKSKTSGSYFETLKGLDEETRRKIDQKARLFLVDDHPESLESALASKSYRDIQFNLFKQGGKPPFKGVDQAVLLDSLERGEESFRIRGEGVVYEVNRISGDADWRVPTFEEAKEQGILEALVLKKLMPVYNQMKNHFGREGGSYKELAEVREEVAEAAFRKVLHQLKRVAPGVKTPDLLAPYRFKSYLDHFRSSGNFDLARRTGDKFDFENQFYPIQVEEKVMRGIEGPFPFPVVAKLEAGTPSEVIVENGKTCFLVVKKRGIGDYRPVLSQTFVKANQQLSGAATQELFNKIFSDMRLYGAVPPL